MILLKPKWDDVSPLFKILTFQMVITFKVKDKVSIMAYEAHYSFSHLTSYCPLAYSISAALASLWFCEHVTHKDLLICYPLCLECSSSSDPQGTCSLLSLHSTYYHLRYCVFSCLFIFCLHLLECKHTGLSSTQFIRCVNEWYLCSLIISKVQIRAIWKVITYGSYAKNLSLIKPRMIGAWNRNFYTPVVGV